MFVVVMVVSNTKTRSMSRPANFAAAVAGAARSALQMNMLAGPWRSCREMLSGEALGETGLNTPPAAMTPKNSAGRRGCPVERTVTMGRERNDDERVFARPKFACGGDGDGDGKRAWKRERRNEAVCREKRRTSAWRTGLSGCSAKAWMGVEGVVGVWGELKRKVSMSREGMAMVSLAVWIMVVVDLRC
jgi:hypothetical protein